MHSKANTAFLWILQLRKIPGNYYELWNSVCNLLTVRPLDPSKVRQHPRLFYAGWVIAVSERHVRGVVLMTSRYEGYTSHLFVQVVYRWQWAGVTGQTSWGRGVWGGATGWAGSGHYPAFTLCVSECVVEMLGECRIRLCLRIVCGTCDSRSQQLHENIVPDCLKFYVTAI